MGFLFSTGRCFSLTSRHVPAHKHFFHRFDHKEKHKSQQRKNEHACKDQPGIKFAIGNQQQIPKTGVGTHELPHDRADDCERTCNFQATEYGWQCIWKSDMPKHLKRRRAHRADEVNGFGLRRPKTDDSIHYDGKK
jgi:hypothetical protein